METLPIVFYRAQYYNGKSYTGLFPIHGDDTAYKRIDLVIDDANNFNIEIGKYSKGASLKMTLEAYSNTQKIKVDVFKKKLSDALKKFEL